MYHTPQTHQEPKPLGHICHTSKDVSPDLEDQMPWSGEFKSRNARQVIAMANKDNQQKWENIKLNFRSQLEIYQVEYPHIGPEKEITLAVVNEKIMHSVYREYPETFRGLLLKSMGQYHLILEDHRMHCIQKAEKIALQKAPGGILQKPKKEELQNMDEEYIQAEKPVYPHKSRNTEIASVDKTNSTKSLKSTRTQRPTKNMPDQNLIQTGRSQKLKKNDEEDLKYQKYQTHHQNLQNSKDSKNQVVFPK